MKKIIAILGMITCMFGLAACGAQKEPEAPAFDEAQAIKSGEDTVDAIYQIVSRKEEALYADTEVVYNGLISFKTALEEDIGNYLGTDGGTAESDGDELIIRINLLGSEHNAVVELVLNNKTAEFSSIATNVTYSTGEKIEKAALNTLLGMGTVFCILILISLIISAFGLLPKLMRPKKEEPEKEEKVDTVVSQIAKREELSDDLELAAVISAAIAAYEGSGSTDGFVVRSIRKAYR